MEVASLSAASARSEVPVQLQSKATDQLKAVTGIILSGIEDTPKPPASDGKRLLAVA